MCSDNIMQKSVPFLEITNYINKICKLFAKGLIFCCLYFAYSTNRVSSKRVREKLRIISNDIFVHVDTCQQSIPMNDVYYFN